MYNFAGISTRLQADQFQGIRATIVWSVAPITVAGSAQSTWIGIFGEADPTTHLSTRVAQIGWKELAHQAPRVFWESGADRNHISISYGTLVQPNDHLIVELDRDANGGFTFYLDRALIGKVQLPWAPTFVAATAETHNPSDVLAGSATTPEIISELAWKLNGQWRVLTVAPFATHSQYRVLADPSGTIRIWDLRQHSL